MFTLTKDDFIPDRSLEKHLVSSPSPNIGAAPRGRISNHFIIDLQRLAVLITEKRHFCLVAQALQKLNSFNEDLILLAAIKDDQLT